jgi:hypothetical protein
MPNAIVSRFCFTIACFLIASAQNGEAASRKAEITVNMTTAGLTTNNGNHWRRSIQLMLVLTGGHAIQVARASPGDTSTSQNLVFGGSGDTSTDYGVKGLQTIRVVAGEIVVTSDFPSYQSVLTIKSDGKTTCSAALEFILKPGHSFFDSGGWTNSDMHAEDTECSIRALQQPGG